MITRTELKRWTGFTSFSEFKRNVIEYSIDKNNLLYTNYTYRPPESAFNIKQFQAVLEMNGRELDRAIQKEETVLKKS